MRSEILPAATMTSTLYPLRYDVAKFGRKLWTFQQTFYFYLQDRKTYQKKRSSSPEKMVNFYELKGARLQRTVRLLLRRLDAAVLQTTEGRHVWMLRKERIRKVQYTK